MVPAGEFIMGIRIGRVFGIPIEIDYSWLLIFALFAYTVSAGHFGIYYPQLPRVYHFGLGILTTLLFFASLVAHELAHSYFARRSGIPIAGITLFIFGGVARMKAEPEKPSDELVMALAGPVFSFAAAITAWIISMLSPWMIVSAVFAYVAAANAIVATFNLIPGFPLDGGRVFRAIIWSLTRDLKLATRAASISGQMFGWGLIALGFFALVLGGSLSGVWFMFIGWFLNNAAQSSYHQLLMRRALEGVGVTEVMTPITEMVDARTSVGDLVRERFLRTHADSYPVVSDTGATGIVRIEDVRNIPHDKWSTTAVGEITKPITKECSISSDADAWAAASMLSDTCPSKVVVYDDGSVVGTIGQENLARLLRTRAQLDIDEAA
ncbi:MAG: site-2 protease family protein [Armatimonadota bacterium]|nr:site-2 protease family protein [Armatimonadota bacterium]